MFFLREKIEIYSEKRYGSQISKTNGTTTNGSTASFDKLRAPLTTKYYYDGDELILEKSGAAMLYYIHGPRIDEIISDSRGYCYHTDGLGSIVNLTDSSGNKANSYTYMAFGKMRNQSGTVSNPWLFTGRQYDSESGLYYYRNRYYDPKTGRFITRDPIGIAGGINLYQYCGNNPVNYKDPYGNIAIADDVALLAIAVSAGAVIANTDWQAVGGAINDAVVTMSKRAPTLSGVWPPTTSDLGIVEPGDLGMPPKIPFEKIPKWAWPLPFIEPVKNMIDGLFEESEAPK